MVTSSFAVLCFFEALYFWLINQPDTCPLFSSSRGWLNGKSFSLAGREMSVTTPLSHCGAEAATDSMQMNDCGRGPMNLHFQKLVVGQTGPVCYSLLALILVQCQSPRNVSNSKGYAFMGKQGLCLGLCLWSVAVVGVRHNSSQQLEAQAKQLGYVQNQKKIS